MGWVNNLIAKSCKIYATSPPPSLDLNTDIGLREITIFLFEIQQVHRVSASVRSVLDVMFHHDPL